MEDQSTHLVPSRISKNALLTYEVQSVWYNSSLNKLHHCPTYFGKGVERME